MPSVLWQSLAFFLITYAVTWSAWFGWLHLTTGPRWFLFYLGVFAPGLVALGLTWKEKGQPAVRSLLARIFRWQVAARWYLFAIGYIATIKLLAAVAQRAFTGTWPSFGQEPWLLMVAAIVFSTWVQAGEELGWRGYALPRLSVCFGLAGASVIVGVLWAAWHLPLFFVPAGDLHGQSFPLYLLQVTALSVAMGWLYWHTDGSLLLVMLFHAAANNTKDIVPSAVVGATNSLTLNASLVGWLTVALLWICAAYFLIRMHRATLESGAEKMRTKAVHKC
jgi:membrane protease YdiL (CAAX protease family)